MAQVRLQASGPAAAAVVWQRYVDPSLWRTWAPQINGVEYPHARLTAGASGHVIGPLGLRVPFTIDSVAEEGRTWSWTVALRAMGRDLVRMHLGHGVQADGSGSTTWLLLSGRWPVIVGYVPIAQFALRRLTR